ncbi:MAG: hypothetical protein N2Z75_00630 [Meiothermus sp.]|uniref:hypothetical protein n=1 Tax=Meiothermus sp. TaxID=1955249 RepID=UPI0025E778C8|nr:hypothetical protein [Meiothermus sp.]MCS7067342.1 hypothetical protein [Meiothermus sp.]MCX7600426.1 hypothetical protein [Meiothermus sp.]MDW8424709.1 hypothetical protein [Meiothermus sp.]
MASINLYELFRPLASGPHSGEIGGVPYLLQPSFPLLLANTAFGYAEAAQRGIEARFQAIGAPPAFTLPEAHDASALLEHGYQPSAVFELCLPEPSPRAYWTEQVPWSEAWSIARILTEAYHAPEWRFPFSHSVGKLLQNPHNQAFVGYLYGEAVGAILVSREAGLLAGVVPNRLGRGVGAALLGRIHPRPFLRLAGTEAEWPGQVQSRFVRYALAG